MLIQIYLYRYDYKNNIIKYLYAIYNILYKKEKYTDGIDI